MIVCDIWLTIAARMELEEAEAPTSGRLVAAGARVLAQGSAEVLVHHRADVALEVGEEDAAGAQVLGSRRQLLVLLLDGRGPRGTEPAHAVLGLLHLRIQSQLLHRRRVLICGKYFKY